MATPLPSNPGVLSKLGIPSPPIMDPKNTHAGLSGDSLVVTFG